MEISGPSHALFHAPSSDKLMTHYNFRIKYNINSRIYQDITAPWQLITVKYMMDFMLLPWILVKMGKYINAI